jgi:hypothetical protein
MSAKFKGQRQWIREVLNKFDKLAEHQPKPFDQPPEWPEWVSNLLGILLGIVYPGVKFKNIKKWKAKDLGRFLGRQYAWEYLVHGGVPLSPQVIQEGERFERWAEKRAKEKRPDVDLHELEKQYQQDARAWRPIFIKFMQETLSSACERPYIESSAFFEAFGKSIVIKPDELLTARTMGVGDKICWTMITMWPEIERLESVAQLHRVFEQALKPKGITVKYKRIEKLCQRIKLKFKDRGRPQGSKNSDKSEVAQGVF